jgi:hypothetical protein
MITCIVCGCTDDNACVDGTTGESCSWVPIPTGPGIAVMQINGGGICSFCAEEMAGYDGSTDGNEEFPAQMRAALERGFNKPSDDERDAPLVELVSDAEADRFLRARRAGA